MKWILYKVLTKKITWEKMKPSIVAVDEMFPEGAGPYMDIEEVCKGPRSTFFIYFFHIKW